MASDAMVAAPQNAVSKARATMLFLNLVVSVVICSPNQYLSRKKPEDQLAAHMEGMTDKKRELIVVVAKV